VSFEPVDFYVRDSTPFSAPVAGATVKVLSADGKLVYGQITTDLLGHAGFLLPSGIPFQARFYKFQVGFTNPQLFTVLPSPLLPGQSNVFDVAAVLITPPVPTDPRLCTAYGFFRDPTGAPQEGVDIHFIAKFDPVWLEGAAVLKERVIVRTDERGYAQVNLIRNGQYDVTVQGEEDVVRAISVPDYPNVNLPDLLFPIVSKVVLTPSGPYSLRVGEELALGLEVFSSAGASLGVGTGDIMLSTSDGSVLNYTISPTGLTLLGVGSGTAQINIVRADLSIVPSRTPGSRVSRSLPP
jgi:hypothetical protein